MLWSPFPPPLLYAEARVPAHSSRYQGWVPDSDTELIAIFKKKISQLKLNYSIW
jgi:hypothetical protein